MSGEASLNAIVAAQENDALLDIFTNKQDSLAAAFAFFNETSEQLTRSYHLLEQKVAQLNGELQRVSAEKDQEQSGREQLANRMQALLEVLPAGVIVLDTRGFIVDANPAAETLLAKDLVGRVWRDVIAESFAPKNDDGLEVSTKSGRRISVATSSLDGSRGNRSGGQLILLTDLTETRRLQQHLSRSERLSAMGKMVSALAHQVRTPLSAAMLYAEHLCHNNLDSSRRDEFSQKLYGRLQHMERQVRDMLLFVKSELPLNELISSKDLLQGIQAAAEMPLSTSHSTCNWQLHSDVLIKCNREALISAIMNLINNSIQAVSENAEISVQMRRGYEIPEKATGNLCIEISDKGPGIAADLLNHAKDIFVTTKSQGTGLGLSVVQSVVRAHGGTFNLYSEPGEGVTALLQIPIYDAAHQPLS